MQSLEYLSRLCRRWDGELRIMPDRDYRALDFEEFPMSEHPSLTHGINWDHRVVFARQGDENVGAIIHEMGHVFLAEGRPDMCYEPDWLGWEIALARRARCFGVWSEQNAGYVIDWNGYSEWEEMPRTEMREYCRNRVRRAQRLKLIDRDGAPRCTRRP